MVFATIASTITAGSFTLPTQCFGVEHVAQDGKDVKKPCCKKQEKGKKCCDAQKDSTQQDGKEKCDKAQKAACKDKNAKSKCCKKDAKATEPAK